MNYTELAREHIADLIKPALARSSVFAAELGISTVSLRRKLRAEGTSWEEILRAEIDSRILELERHGVRLKDIADELGYAEVTSAQRARVAAMRRHLTQPNPTISQCSGYST
jgi:branched-subunit amino acid aminotransferase/4-amino-4-deoxychorismate lyase